MLPVLASFVVARVEVNLRDASLMPAVAWPESFEYVCAAYV